MDKVKNLGQVMTPVKIVNHMIDDVLKLNEEQLKSYLFLDNSCGDGAFIKGLISRGVPPQNIYACDIDSEISVEVRKILPKENFRLGSFFEQRDLIGKFDIVIGNPPYVKIHNINSDIKKQIANFDFCKGSYDLYYAFYEFGFKMLNEKGSLIYISPNSFIQNVSGKNMRAFIESNNILAYYEDLSACNQFEGVSTYTCIMMLSKCRESIKVPWKNNRAKKGLSYSSLQNGIATLVDKIFIADRFDGLEKECIKPIIKASTGEIKECIYPPKTEEELKQYPNTYSYLLNYRDKLENRSLQSYTNWFEFGRKQGLKNINNEKIAISPIMLDELKIFRVSSEFLVYSGFYVTANDLDKLEKELKNRELINYLKANGKAMRGGYTQISTTLLKNY